MSYRLPIPLDRLTERPIAPSAYEAPGIVHTNPAMTFEDRLLTIEDIAEIKFGSRRASEIARAYKWIRQMDLSLFRNSTRKNGIGIRESIFTRFLRLLDSGLTPHEAENLIKRSAEIGPLPSA